MNNKILLSSISLTILFNLISCLPVSAHEPYNELRSKNTTEGGLMFNFHPSFENVEFNSLNWERDYDFLVVTTLDGLQEDFANNYSYIESVVEWKDFVSTMEQSTNPIIPTLSNVNDLRGKYGEFCRFYRVKCKSGLQDIYRIARRVSQSNASVLDTLMLERSTLGKCEWDGTYTLTLNHDLTDKYRNGEINEQNLEEMFPNAYKRIKEDSEWLATRKNEYSAFEQEFSIQEQELAEKGYSDRDIRAIKLQSLNSKHLTSPDSWTMYAIDAATSVYVEYKNQLSSFSPNFEMYDWGIVYRTYSAWNGVGDMNEDNIINSMDATEILIESARTGTGQATLSTYESQFGDINCDGKVNAEDAAIILRYSAVIGTGSLLSLEEFYKNSCFQKTAESLIE